MTEHPDQQPPHPSPAPDPTVRNANDSPAAALPTAHSPAAPPPAADGPNALPPSLQGRYRLIRVLGKGGFANVYLAHDNVLDQQVAIKLLKLGQANKSDQDRFLREARISARLRHPNIATIFDIIQAPDGLQMIMEYYPGGTLTDLVRQSGPLRPARAIAIARQLGLALAHAHRHEFIHRDIKPANVFFDRDGMVKLGDFGIAASVTSHEFTQTGMIIGTPLYMAPEQSADSRDVDPRADIYSLGLTLFYMLTGRSPRILDLDEVPTEFRTLIKSSTDADRTRRMVSAEQFIATLDQVERQLRGQDKSAGEEVGAAATALSPESAPATVLAATIAGATLAGPPAPATQGAGTQGPPTGVPDTGTSPTNNPAPATGHNTDFTSAIAPAVGGHRAFWLIAGLGLMVALLIGFIMAIFIAPTLRPGVEVVAEATPAANRGPETSRIPGRPFQNRDRSLDNGPPFPRNRPSGNIRRPGALPPEIRSATPPPATPTPSPSPAAKTPAAPTPTPTAPPLEQVEIAAAIRRLLADPERRTLRLALEDFRNIEERRQNPILRQTVESSLQQVRNEVQRAIDEKAAADIPPLQVLLGYALWRAGHRPEAARAFEQAHQYNERLATPYAFDLTRLKEELKIDDTAVQAMRRPDRPGLQRPFNQARPRDPRTAP